MVKCGSKNQHKKKQYAQNMLTVIGSTINMIGGGPTLLGEASLWQWIRHLYKQYKANGYGYGFANCRALVECFISYKKCA